mgnify:CR=1 FL=1
MRQVVLDTETTGIGAEKGHRIIEIGCVELIDRKLTGRHYHQYVNPQRPSDDKPLFGQVAHAFAEFIDGAELVIHNAPFDVGFMDAEFRRLDMPMTTSFCSVLDTLVMARDMRPGQRNSLDALCKSYGIDNSHRELHGALLDAEILSDVYLMMTGGQTDLLFSAETSESVKELARTKLKQLANVNAQTLSIVRATADEMLCHDEIMDILDKKSDGAIWRR